MTHTVILLESADADLSDAACWYHDLNPGLDADFMLCVEETLDRLARYSLAFARVEGEYRRAAVHRFPFGVIYRVTGEHVIVLAVLHTSRNPMAWRSRDH